MTHWYESSDAFGKAFSAMFGVSTSAVRKNDVTLTAFPPMFFHLTLKGGIKMDYRTVEKGDFYVMGKSGRIPLIYHGNNPHFNTVWQKLKDDGILVLTEYAKCEPKGIVEVYADCGVEGEDFTLYVGIVMEGPMPAYFKGRFDVLPFKASTWLVFTAVDNTTREDGTYVALPGGRKQMHKDIGEWMPTSEYEQTAPQIVSFLSYDMYRPDLKSEIWVPVRKRGPS
jgi:AraC family transcriptional regulator